MALRIRITRVIDKTANVALARGVNHLRRREVQKVAVPLVGILVQAILPFFHVDDFTHILQNKRTLGNVFVGKQTPAFVLSLNSAQTSVKLREPHI